jgi:predicted lipase
MIKSTKIKRNDIYIHIHTHNTGALAALCAVDLQVVYKNPPPHPNIHTHTHTHNTGALAALCAVDLQVVYKESSSTPKQVNLFTLGQPRVGNQDFSDFVWEQLPTATRVVHQNDVGKFFYFLFFIFVSF